MLRLLTIIGFLASAVSFLYVASQGPDYLADSLAKREPQAIYSADPHDPWSRIFYLLFTRTVETRLTDDFKSEGPFVSSSIMGNPALQATSRTVQRIESGDRAIDPLYPNLFSTKGSEPILTDPGFSELKQALLEACAETTRRAPLQRALMQSDVWAAREIVSWSSDAADPQRDHARQLLPILDRFIAQLALSSAEIAALPRNYQAAQPSMNLPRVFDEHSGWIEIEWFPVRSHDEMGHNRHAARIFLKPHASPESFLKEVNESVRKHHDPLPNGLRDLDAAALITEVLLIDKTGRVVPTPLTSDLQLRTVIRDAQGNFKGSSVEEYELSRRSILSVPSSGGFIHRSQNEPAYLPAAGNDFTFASRMTAAREPEPPILGTLRRRCESCHFEAAVFTFLTIQIPGRQPLPVRELRPADDERASYVAEKKMKSREFKSLQLGR